MSQCRVRRLRGTSQSSGGLEWIISFVSFRFVVSFPFFVASGTVTQSIVHFSRYLLIAMDQWMDPRSCHTLKLRYPFPKRWLAMTLFGGVCTNREKSFRNVSLSLDRDRGSSSARISSSRFGSHRPLLLVVPEWKFGLSNLDGLELGSRTDDGVVHTCLRAAAQDYEAGATIARASSMFRTRSWRHRMEVALGRYSDLSRSCKFQCSSVSATKSGNPVELFHRSQPDGQVRTGPRSIR